MNTFHKSTTQELRLRPDMISTTLLLAALTLIPDQGVESAIATAQPIALLGCQNFAVQAGTTITFGGSLTTITSGDIGVSPGTSITGNYKLVTGTAHSDDFFAQQCSTDLKVAYEQAAAQTCTDVIESDLADRTLTPGVYCTPSGKFAVSAGTVTLDARGNPEAQWIFQTDTTLVTAGATTFELVNGARSGNVYWAIGSSATLGSSSSIVGNILAQVSITFGSGSNIVGRGLAQAAVTFASGSNTDQGQQTIGLPAVYLPSATTSIKVQAIGTRTSSVSIGGCQNSAIQAQTTITFGGEQTTITSGDIGVAPGTSITGNYKLISGTAHSNDEYAQQCTKDMKTAYTQASSLTCTNQIGSELSGLTLFPGVYCTTDEKFTLSSGTLTLDALGNPYAEWVFQMQSTLITSISTTIKLQNNARAENVYWAVGSSATVGGSSNMVGNILAQVSITFGSGSNVDGRGLAQAAVTFASGSNTDKGQQFIGLPVVYVPVGPSINSLRGSTPITAAEISKI